MRLGVHLTRLHLARLYLDGRRPEETAFTGQRTVQRKDPTVRAVPPA